MADFFAPTFPEETLLENFFFFFGGHLSQTVDILFWVISSCSKQVRCGAVRCAALRSSPDFLDFLLFDKLIYQNHYVYQ